MLTLIRTDSSQQDFQALVRLLDADLRLRDGEDHEFYAQYNKIDSIQQGIESALMEKRNGKAKKRIEIGKERLQLFRWDKSAAQTLTILEQVGRGEL